MRRDALTVTQRAQTCPEWEIPMRAFTVSATCGTRKHGYYTGYFVYRGGRPNPYFGPTDDKAVADALAAKLNGDQVPVLPSTADFDTDERAGLTSFWAGALLVSAPSDAARRGWWSGHRHAYALGFHAGAIGGDEVEAPYPQFSGAWEAWGDGYNDAMVVFHGAEVGS